LANALLLRLIGLDVGAWRKDTIKLSASLLFDIVHLVVSLKKVPAAIRRSSNGGRRYPSRASGSRPDSVEGECRDDGCVSPSPRLIERARIRTTRNSIRVILN